MRTLVLLGLTGLLTPSLSTAQPLSELARAHAIAKVEPRRDAFANGAQVFVYSEGALYQIYAAPGRITDLALQPGESLVEPGGLAAGDTVRWVIAQTFSGAGADRRTHVLVKPVTAGLRTNLIVNTDRRTYHLELLATAGPYLPLARWRYPADEAKAAAAAEASQRAMALAAAARKMETPTEPVLLNFDYVIRGHASFRPRRVYDDGRQTFIEFAPTIVQGDLPPLFLSGANGALELVNYRVQGHRLIVDRLFDRAELRLRQGRKALAIELVRKGGGA